MSLIVIALFALLPTAIVCQECCPDGSWGELTKKGDAPYVDKGVVDEGVGGSDLDIYRVGNSSKAIIWNYDIFGFDSGRTRELADLFASKGYMVLIPDYYRGKLNDPSKPNARTGEFIKNETDWQELKKDWEKVICPYAKRLGAKSIGAIGTCWGSYMVIRLSAYPEVTAGVSMHPSHSPIMSNLGEDEKEILEAIPASNYQLFMPAGSDHANVKPDGLGENVLKERLQIVEFPEMRHGWTTRGDLSSAAVERDVKKAIDLAIKHFDKHLKDPKSD